MHIAQRHLLPKLLTEHGLSAGQLTFPREVLETVAAGWTREAGVRRLSQVCASGDGAAAMYCTCVCNVWTVADAEPAFVRSHAARPGVQQQMGLHPPLNQVKAASFQPCLGRPANGEMRTPMTCSDILFPTCQGRVQALAAICRHVAVDVVTAAERDSQQAPGTVPIEPVPLAVEEQPSGEEAHQRTVCWDSPPTVSARSSLASAWQGSGGRYGRFRQSGVQHVQQSRTCSTAGLQPPLVDAEVAADALSLPFLRADEAQQSMVRQLPVAADAIRCIWRVCHM